jgi:3-oxoadipate enol-lactonase
MTVAVHHVLDGPPGDAPEDTTEDTAEDIVVVLSGSLGSDLRMWEPQVAPLVAAGFLVVRYDHRGHGGSPVPPGPYALSELGEDAIALLDRLGRDRVHWVGLSLGGMVGMWLGRHAPHRLASLTLCCTSARLGPPEMWARRAGVVRAEGTRAVADAAVSRWITDGYAEANPERVDWLRAMVAATPAEGYASCCAAIERMDLVADLPAITAPTLVISGSQDPATPVEHGRRIMEGVPGARLEILDPAAHLASVEQPEKTSQLIIDHVRASAGRDTE